ncbi:MAG: DUF2937 family protein [Wenzhouxiangella sp.]
MGWIARKADNLGSACCGAGGGMGLSQAPAFTQAYLQRLGGHLDEARRTLRQVESGELLGFLSPPERVQAVGQFHERVIELDQAYRSISEATPLMQPLMTLRYADSEIAARAWESFTPAIPIDPPSLIYTGVGVVVALLVYELIKSPAALFGGRRNEQVQRNSNR